MIRERSCGAVVYKTVGDSVLYLIERMAKGHVSIPKGHVEGNETEEQTAIREIKEETNLDVILDTRFRAETEYSPYEGCVKTVTFFVAEAVSDELINQESEVSSLEWLPFEAARESLTYVQNANSNRMAYMYDTNYRIYKIYNDKDKDGAIDSNEEYVQYSYSSTNRLSGITNGTSSYTLTYDYYGNISSIAEGGVIIASYTYNNNNGKLIQVSHGGMTETKIYDALDRISEIKYNNTVEENETIFDDYDDSIIRRLVDTINVNSDNSITVFIKGGLEIKQVIGE